jgi:hypothetical protein
MPVAKKAKSSAMPMSGARDKSKGRISAEPNR